MIDRRIRRAVAATINMKISSLWLLPGFMRITVISYLLLAHHTFIDCFK
jgi:2-phosphoglycerate kinase